MYRFISKIVREDNVLSLTGNLIIAVLGFSGFALLARSLTPNQFAQWVLFIAGGSLVEMLRFGITNNGLVRFLAGASNKDSDILIGSNVLISLLATVFISALIVLINQIFHDSISSSSYRLFFSWYPILAFVNLAWNNATVVLQAKMKYDKILIIKAINSGLFFIVLVVNIKFNFSIATLVIALLITNLITSLVCIFKSWDGFHLLRKANLTKIKTLLHFGKFSTFTLLGTNLLRNADILIISISPLGSEAVALFSIPLKLTELQQIPLRSFVATAYPKMSKASLAGKMKELKSLFNTYAGALTYFFLFLSIISFVFAEEFVILISGDQYLNSSIKGFNIVTIVKILSVYGLLLPIDRMTGIALDSINKPNINAFKVIVMLGFNIIGDIIAVYVFASLEIVAVSTLVFTLVGIILGIYFLRKEFRFSSFEIMKSANSFYKILWFRIKAEINLLRHQKSP